MDPSNTASVSRNIYTWTRGHYFISTDPRELDLDFVYKYITSLNESNEPLCRTNFKRILNFSLCFGLFVTLPQEYGSQGMPAVFQIGFARVATDYIRLAYLCNIHVSQAYEGYSLQEWLMEIVLSYPELQSIHWVVRTSDIMEGRMRPSQKRDTSSIGEQLLYLIENTRKRPKLAHDMASIVTDG
ncbi:hypothetical protein K493DRAFT_307927 [Basidiobolus meristosporus CBS 931.73]|uniref:Uncharacterized protein n=1 Tax=Basidiobolus meristosporus CBS 931.73 TaxID=1314790 RepID=A0A1Y1X9I6_9FUNG|nr:hypothetical protein K493DRAFT_307927 [Basidiobolus meristosporus CBS 931.73]|eukprot:ORX81994.1 hypothetical protein K493DRAFT_307927 [Basidiobolus meristosporus CBS 931.73]